MTEYNHKKQSRIYRSRNGKVLGICQGMADYFNISVFWIRFALLAVLILTGFWPLILVYFGAAFVLKEEPILPFVDADESEFYSSYTTSREMGLQRLKREFDNLNRRISRIEDAVTTKDYSWEKKYQKS